jgi:ABC-type nitrate/sulfonate/bicarbonate transport system ATPase subunit
MSALFTARDVSKGFDVKGRRLQALKGLSLSVEAGGFTALVGPDGAGKTTMLRIAAGLLAPEKGELFFEGQPLKPERTEAQQDAIGYMPQKFGLYEDLSVQENLDLYADLKGVGMKEREERYRRLLSMAGLSDFRERLAGKLSGGMKQKLGLICTLVAPPKLLILDEPTVGVDPLSRRELWEIVEELTGRVGHGRAREHVLPRRGAALRRGRAALAGRDDRRGEARRHHAAHRGHELPRGEHAGRPAARPAGKAPRPAVHHRRAPAGRRRAPRARGALGRAEESPLGGALGGA